MSPAARLRVTVAILLSTALSGSVWAQGYVLPSVGPVNGSMAGAGTAAPLDAVGSVYWNPASILAVGNRVDIAGEAINVRAETQTTAGPFSGRNSSDSGVFALPATAAIYAPEDADWAVGIGLNGIGGFLTNYPASLTDPMFAPPPFGNGAVYSRLAVMQIAPTLALQLTENLSVGVAPTISAAELQADPFPLNGPNANFTYPAGTHGRARWGGGVQAGVFYQAPADVALGFSVKSPQWFEPFEYNAMDAGGVPRKLQTDYEFPMIVSGGVSWTGIERLVLAADLRYVDYASTSLFGDPAGFAPNGAVTGLGWESIFVAAFGGQYSLTDRLDVRAGYSISENPIPDSVIAFNTQAPAIHQHILALGSSLRLTDAVALNIAWQHLFANQATGPLYAPGIGAVPGTALRVEESVDAVIAGLSFVY